MKIIWQTQAADSYRQVAHYISARFGRKARREFMQRVKDAERLIKRNPNIFPIDPLYADSPVPYRSIVINGLNKLVYRVDDDVIHIVDFWDTRREPKVSQQSL